MNPNEKQKQAILATQSVAVLAGAGSGKTGVLIERIRHLVLEQKLPLHCILAFTFTEKAAGEMRERLFESETVSEKDYFSVNISTLHSFLAGLLRKHGSVLGLDPEFSVKDESQACLEIEEETAHWLKSRLDSPFYEAFGFQRLLEMILHLMADTHLMTCDFKSGLSSEEENLLNQVRSLYFELQNERIKNASLTFDDLEILGLKLLDNSSLLVHLHEEYRHILVDEFQDINFIQGEIIHRLWKPEKNFLFIVGDTKQSIYGFRKADLKVFDNTLEKIKNHLGEIITLNQSYRFGSQICEKVNLVFNDLHFDKMESATNHEDCVRVVKLPYSENVHEHRLLEAAFIAQHLKEVSPEQWGQTILLFKTGSFMPSYQEILEKAGIPCEISKNSNLFDEPETKALLHILCYLFGEKNRLMQTGVMLSCFFNFSSEFVEGYINSQARNFLDSFILDLFTSSQDHAQWQKLIKLIEKWEELKPVIAVDELVWIILKDVGIKLTENTQQRTNVEQFLGLTKMFKDWAPQKILATLNHMLWGGITIPIRGNPVNPGMVKLATIHATKGLEFDSVFLVNLSGGTKHPRTDYIFVPHQGIAFKKPGPVLGLASELIETEHFLNLQNEKKKKDWEEEMRLLYVAMTRAKKQLTLFIKPTVKKTNKQEIKNWNDWILHVHSEE